MSMILISGGSGSGKSAYAEARAVSMHKKGGGSLIYAATMMIYDEESRQRVERHRQMRAGKGFVTHEVSVNIVSLPANSGDTVLVECLSNLLANEMYEPSGAGESCSDAIVNGLRCLLERGVRLVIVTNEVFSDGIRYDDSTMLYLERLGKINVSLAEMADEVIEVVAGIPVIWKGENASCLLSEI